MIPMPSTTRVTATPVLSYPAHDVRARYERLDPAEQRRLLLAHVREHAAPLDSRALLHLLSDIADTVTPFGRASFGDSPDAHRPPTGAVEGPVYLDLTLVETGVDTPITTIEKPFVLSMLRNPPRFRTGSPTQPQLLITSFPMDVPTAVSTHHRLKDRVERLFERWGYAPPPRCGCTG